MYKGFSITGQEQGIILLAFHCQEQGQAFGVTAAHPHPKIWGVPPRLFQWAFLFYTDHTGQSKSRLLVDILMTDELLVKYK